MSLPSRFISLATSCSMSGMRKFQMIEDPAVWILGGGSSASIHSHDTLVGEISTRRLYVKMMELLKTSVGKVGVVKAGEG